MRNFSLPSVEKTKQINDFLFKYVKTCYNFYEETQRALVSAIYGEIPFKGENPFKLIPDEFKFLKV